MKKNGFGLLIAVLAALGAVAAPRAASAQVEVDIGVRVPLPPLPRLMFPAPPAVVVIPETNIYVVPDVEVDIVYYRGFWYRPYGNRWYRAASYNGPWRLLAAGQVPSTFKKLPPGFRSVKPEHERIPYQKVKKNWKKWEQDRRRDSSRNRRDTALPGQGKGKGTGKGPKK